MFTTIESMLAESSEYDIGKSDVVRSPRGEVKFEVAPPPVDDLCLVTAGDLFSRGREWSVMTDWALGQVCGKLGPPPFKYIRMCPPYLRAENLEYWRRLYPEARKWLVRRYDGQVRGVLSSEYVPVGNTWVLESLLQLLSEGVQGGMPYKLTRSSVSPDLLQLRVVVADSSHENYGIGFYLANGEIGNSMVRVQPLIQRSSCENSIAFVEGGFFQRHFKVTLAFLKGAIKEKIGQAIGLAGKYLEAVVEAEMRAIPDIAGVVARLCETHGFKQEIHDLILIGTEGKQTLGGVVNGVSFAAHQQGDSMVMEQMESLAGSIILDPSAIYTAGVVDANIEE